MARPESGTGPDMWLGDGLEQAIDALVTDVISFRANVLVLPQQARPLLGLAQIRGDVSRVVMHFDAVQLHYLQHLQPQAVPPLGEAPRPSTHPDGEAELAQQLMAWAQQVGWDSRYQCVADMLDADQRDVFVQDAVTDLARLAHLAGQMHTAWQSYRASGHADWLPEVVFYHLWSPWHHHQLTATRLHMVLTAWLQDNSPW